MAVNPTSSASVLALADVYTFVTGHPIPTDWMSFAEAGETIKSTLKRQSQHLVELATKSLAFERLCQYFNFEADDPDELATRIIKYSAERSEKLVSLQALVSKYRYLRRHASSLEEAVTIMTAVKLLGGGANLYDMTTSSRPHWLVEIYGMYKHNDWTEQEEDEVR